MLHVLSYVFKIKGLRNVVPRPTSPPDIPKNYRATPSRNTITHHRSRAALPPSHCQHRHWPMAFIISNSREATRSQTINPPVPHHSHTAGVRLLTRPLVHPHASSAPTNACTQHTSVHNARPLTRSPVPHPFDPFACPQVFPPTHPLAWSTRLPACPPSHLPPTHVPTCSRARSHRPVFSCAVRAAGKIIP